MYPYHVRLNSWHMLDINMSLIWSVSITFHCHHPGTFRGRYLHWIASYLISGRNQKYTGKKQKINIL